MSETPFEVTAARATTSPRCPPFRHLSIFCEWAFRNRRVKKEKKKKKKRSKSTRDDAVVRIYAIATLSKQLVFLFFLFSFMLLLPLGTT